MPSNTGNNRAKLAELHIIRYGDPRLQQMSSPVAQVDDFIRSLAQRMLELMFEARGVGLAAPQVGINIRLFVASPTFEPADRRVYINPRIISADGWQETEEGCLSFPQISATIKRRNIVTVAATALDGKEFEETGEGLPARIYQHEIDHLDGMLLVDRMTAVARLSHRRALADLKERNAPAKTK